MVRKQALAAAESLLEEIELQPFTYCDPGDTAASTATSSAGCTTTAQSMDNPANWGVGKTRYGPVFFDNVADYNGFTMAGTLNDIFQQSSTRLVGLQRFGERNSGRHRIRAGQQCRRAAHRRHRHGRAATPSR